MKTPNIRRRQFHSHPAVPCLAGVAFLMAAASLCQAQLTPGQISQIKAINESRVSSFDVLAGDYGVSGGTYSSGGGHGINGFDVNVSKFGGMGVIGFGPLGSPLPLGNTGIGWQPQVQGSMGYMTADKRFGDNTPNLTGDVIKYNTFAIQFGGGAKFWLNDRISFTPSIMGMYGHTENEYNHNGTGLTQSQYEDAVQAGLIGWNVDSWTVRPAGELAYNYVWGRTIFTLSTSGTYYYTESFQSSSDNFNIYSGAEIWKTKIDVDTPLGVELFGHELRTGGYYARDQFYGDLQQGLNTDYLNEIHGRIVLDFLNQLWKVQWLGIGVSYLWGANDLHGVAYGIDACFRF